jgi:hypothetical protein
MYAYMYIVWLAPLRPLKAGIWSLELSVYFIQAYVNFMRAIYKDLWTVVWTVFILHDALGAGNAQKLMYSTYITPC